MCSSDLFFDLVAWGVDDDQLPVRKVRNKFTETCGIFNLKAVDASACAEQLQLWPRAEPVVVKTDNGDAVLAMELAVGIGDVVDNAGLTRAAGSGDGVDSAESAGDLRALQ